MGRLRGLLARHGVMAVTRIGYGESRASRSRHHSVAELEGAETTLAEASRKSGGVNFYFALTNRISSK